MDLTYITHRIIAMGFPSSGAEGIYRNPLPEVQRFLHEYHAGKFMVYNLCSERDYPPAEVRGGRARLLAMLGDRIVHTAPFIPPSHLPWHSSRAGASVFPLTTTTRALCG